MSDETAKLERVAHRLRGIARDMRDFGEELRRTSRLTNKGRRALHFAERIDRQAEHIEEQLGTEFAPDTDPDGGHA